MLRPVENGHTEGEETRHVRGVAIYIPSSVEKETKKVAADLKFVIVVYSF